MTSVTQHYHHRQRHPHRIVAARNGASCVYSPPRKSKALEFNNVALLSLYLSLSALSLSSPLFPVPYPFHVPSLTRTSSLSLRPFSRFYLVVLRSCVGAHEGRAHACKMPSLKRRDEKRRDVSGERKKRARGSSRRRRVASRRG